MTNADFLEQFESASKTRVAGKTPEINSIESFNAWVCQKFSWLDKINEKTPRACEDIKMLLNNIFDYAVNNGIIERNPIKAVYLPKHERKNGIAFTQERERKFICEIKGSKYENYFLKMLYSGVRPTEVITIQEDFANNTITVKNSKLKSYQKNLYRTIPMFPKYRNSIRNCNLEKASLEQLRIEFKKYCPDNTLMS